MSRFYLKKMVENPEMTFGVGIALMNIINIRLKRDRNDPWSIMRYTTVSIMKGGIYGMFFPIATINILLSSFEGPHHFNKHFIPCSVYFKEFND